MKYKVGDKMCLNVEFYPWGWGDGSLYKTIEKIDCINGEGIYHFKDNVNKWYEWELEPFRETPLFELGDEVIDKFGILKGKIETIEYNSKYNAFVYTLEGRNMFLWEDEIVKVIEGDTKKEEKCEKEEKCMANVEYKFNIIDVVDNVLAEVVFTGKSLNDITKEISRVLNDDCKFVTINDVILRTEDIKAIIPQRTKEEDVNTEKILDLYWWLEGEKYLLPIPENCDEMTGAYEEKYKWELSRNKIINNTLNKMVELFNLNL